MCPLQRNQLGCIRRQLDARQAASAKIQTTNEEGFQVRCSTITIGISILAYCASAATPKRDWKDGTLIDVAEVREVAGTSSMARGASVGPPPGCTYCAARGSATGESGVVYATLQGFVIKGDDMKWMVQVRVLPRGMFHPRVSLPNVTIKGPVKYCYEKGRFYLLDEDKREFEMTVMRKEALPPPPPPAAPVAK
jgi:hypothetical protein